MRTLVAGALATIGVVMAIVLGMRASNWNDELAIESPLAGTAPIIDDPHTPRLAHRVVLVIIDGLGADEAGLPFLDELRHRGVAAIARVPYPTISRPNYVSILTGVPPRDSGVRTNRVREPVELDTVMDRVRAAGLRVATASDYGSVASLFLRHTSSLSVEWSEHGDRLSLPPPVSWPFDEVRRAPTLDALGPTIAELARSDAAFVPILVLDVDRAGHAAGVGAEYRAAAAAVDQMLRSALANVDLASDVVIVTADHGHVARGGHGGQEPEVSRVPLVLAGSGIVAGANVRDARLIDVAPTIAALLGVAAPGHAEGRTLVEALALAPDAAARRVAADANRTHTIAAIIDVPHDAFEPLRLALVGVALACAIALAVWLRRRGALVVTTAAPLGATSFVAMLAAVAVITRGDISPSAIPSLARVEQLGAISAVIAIALQLVAYRRARLVAANGIAFVGLAVALVAVCVVRAWFSPPFFDVPSPFWFVGIPALDLAAATCGLATAVALVIAWRSDR